MIIYYSGGGLNDGAKIVLPTMGYEANIMLSFYDSFKFKKREDNGRRKVDATFKAVYKHARETGFNSHFLDSGSFALWTRSREYADENNSSEWSYYETDEHFRYLEAYVKFNKAFSEGISCCANVDVIPDKRSGSEHVEIAENLSWRNQQYLESKDLQPIPVVHYRSDLKWLKHYIALGYEHVAIGGLVGSVGSPGCIDWLDKVFDIVCSSPKRKPVIKSHGFGVMTFREMTRYPWYSIDSTAWVKHAAYGDITVPKIRGGQFRFDEPPLFLTVSHKGLVKSKGQWSHYLGLPKEARRNIEKWLEFLGIPLGSVDDEESEGVLHQRSDRCRANLLYYEEFRKTLPEYPWSYKRTARPSFGF